MRFSSDLVLIRQTPSHNNALEATNVIKDGDTFRELLVFPKFFVVITKTYGLGAETARHETTKHSKLKLPYQMNNVNSDMNW